LREKRATPYSDQSKKEAADGIQRCEQESAGAKIRERLPLIGGECAVGTHKPDRDQETPRWIQIGAPAQVREGKSDDYACRNVDDEGSVREPGAEAAGDCGADPIPCDRA